MIWKFLYFTIKYKGTSGLRKVPYLVALGGRKELSLRRSMSLDLKFRQESRYSRKLSCWLCSCIVTVEVTLISASECIKEPKCFLGS